MSLSDENNFKKFDFKPLEQYNEESTIGANETKIEPHLFELLLDITGYKAKKKMFSSYYNDHTKLIFKPLIERKEENKKLPLKQTSEKKKPEDKKEKSLSNEEILLSIKNKGYKEGYAEGLKKGMEKGEKEGYEKGKKIGYDEGLKKGMKKGIEQGEKKGFKKGQKDGQEKAKQEAYKYLNSLEETLNLADSALEDLIGKYETSIISFIEQIVEKIVMAYVQIKDKVVKNLIIDALKKLIKPEQVVISVAFDDYEYVKSIENKFFEKIESLKKISIESNNSIKKGGCRIKSDSAYVQTDVKSRLEAIFEAMKEEIE